MKVFNYTIHFKNGIFSNSQGVKAENEKEVIRKIIDDRWNSEVIVSITVTEKSKGVQV
jgi:hypothetical protein